MTPRHPDPETAPSGNSALRLLRKHTLDWLAVFIVLGGVFYAATTAWKTEQKVSQQSAQLHQIEAKLDKVTGSLISMLLDEDLDESELVKILVSDSQTIQGISQFRAGNFDAAYDEWTASARQGSEDSAIAILAANTALKQRATDPAVPREQRQKAQVALSRAPLVDLGDDGIQLQTRAPQK